MTPAVEPVSGAAESVAASGPVQRVWRSPDRCERALIAGALAGSEADLEALFRSHWPTAYRAAFLIVHDHAAAEDIAQEAFLAAVRRLDRFDRRRRFGPWLGAIVANRAIDWVRARTARHEVSEPPESGVSEPPQWGVSGSPASGVSESPAGRYSEEVLVALAALSPEHRAVVVLRYVLEYTPGEIARALELPRGTVNSRLRRGLDALEASLKEAQLR